MTGRVLVRLRPEILDPQGETIARALANLGFDTVRSVRQGKVFEIDLEAPDAAAAHAVLERISEQLLANPVIEDFQVSIADAAAAAKSSQILWPKGPRARLSALQCMLRPDPRP